MANRIDIGGSRRAVGLVFLNTGDIGRLGLEKDQWVDLVSHFESETRRRTVQVVPYEIPPGVRPLISRKPMCGAGSLRG